MTDTQKTKYEFKAISLPVEVWAALDAEAQESAAGNYRNPNRSRAILEALLESPRIARRLQALESVAA